MANSVVQDGHTVMLKIPNGEVKSVKLESGGTVSLGRFGSFFADQLIGQMYGVRYEVHDKLLKELPPMAMEDIEETDATNELINDDRTVQPLTTEEIEALKSSGVHVSEIIKRQTEQHASYKLKNEYSKDKYKKRKEAKFSKSFTAIEPTLYNVSQFWFTRDRSRIRDLRIDTLSQMLNLVNVRPGGRYIAIDDVSGLLVAGILDRLGGEGRLMTICDVDGLPAYPATTQMNFPPSANSVLVSLNWANIDEEYVSVALQTEPPRENPNERHLARVNKRKAAHDSLTSLREELFGGEFDGLLVASPYDPSSILDKLEPYLAGSASLVVYSPHIQVVTDLQSTMRDMPQWLGPAVTESWLRQYQVLAGRTHPMMNTSGSGGYLLHAIKVYDDPTASSVMAHRVKKRKAQSTLKEPIVDVPEQDDGVIADTS